MTTGCCLDTEKDRRLTRAIRATGKHSRALLRNEAVPRHLEAPPVVGTS
jgi:hypothetical protein